MAFRCKELNLDDTVKVVFHESKEAVGRAAPVIAVTRGASFDTLVLAMDPPLRMATGRSSSRRSMFDRPFWAFACGVWATVFVYSLTKEWYGLAAWAWCWVVGAGLGAAHFVAKKIE
jgi:hypothetical protein